MLQSLIYLASACEYGGKPEAAFDVVIPSIPGYGFSGKPAVTGWTPVRIANTWIELMRRLGYKKYVAQGRDWANAISEIMGLIAPPELLAIHTNMPATVPADIVYGKNLPVFFCGTQNNWNL
jgi:pimeloyl-ACP methyl ester carboxylesterase